MMIVLTTNSDFASIYKKYLFKKDKVIFKILKIFFKHVCEVLFSFNKLNVRNLQFQNGTDENAITLEWCILVFTHHICSHLSI